MLFCEAYVRVAKIQKSGFVNSISSIEFQVEFLSCKKKRKTATKSR